MRVAIQCVFACVATLGAACSLAVSTAGLTGGASEPADSGTGNVVVDAAPSGSDSGVGDPDAALPTPDGSQLAPDAPIAPSDAGPSDAAPDVTVVVTAYRDAVLADAPLAYWRFGEPVGNIAQDETGNGHAASFGGGFTLGAQGAIAGDSNTAVHLDGSDGLNAGQLFDFPGTAPYSLEGWIKLDAVDTTYRHLFNKDFRPTSGREQYGVFVHSTALLAFERHVAGGAVTITLPLPPLNQWTYVVATYDGANMALYVNGMKGGEIADPRAQLAKPVPEFVGCKASQSGGIRGYLDEFAIYDHALSAARVSAHWAASGL